MYFGGGSSRKKRGERMTGFLLRKAYFLFHSYFTWMVLQLSDFVCVFEDGLLVERGGIRPKIILGWIVSLSWH